MGTLRNGLKLLLHAYEKGHNDILKYHCAPFYLLLNYTVFSRLSIKLIIVIGPTPPGTGVMYSHLGETLS